MKGRKTVKEHPYAPRPRLRILLDPVYIQSAALRGSSTYYKYLNLAKALVERGHFVYWMIPDADYVPHELENHPNVGVIRTTPLTDQFVADGMVTNEFFNLFNRMAGKYHIDVCVTGRTSLALMYKRLLEPPRYHDKGQAHFSDKNYGLPVVVLEEFPQTRSAQHSSEAYWINQCLGYIAADRTVFLSDHNREEVVREMRNYITTSQIQKWLEKKVRVIGTGVSLEELESVYDPRAYKKSSKFDVLSVGRIFNKTYVEYFPWFDYLFKSGQDDVRLTISLSGSLSGPMRAKLGKTGFDFGNLGRQFRLLEKNSRTNYLKMVPRFNAFVCPISHLDYPTAALETLYLGVPGIFPVSDYQQAFFSDYPFVIEPDDKVGFLATLNWIKENQEEARALVAPWKDRIAGMYDNRKNLSDLVDVVEGAAHEYISRFTLPKGALDFLRELKGESYSWEDIVAYLKRCGKWGVQTGTMYMRSSFFYARGCISHGMVDGNLYVDPCDGPDVRFVRKDVYDREYANKTKELLLPDEQDVEDAIIATEETTDEEACEEDGTEA